METFIHDFMKEIKGICTFCLNLAKSQLEFEESVVKKFIKIDYLFENMLKSPLNQHHLQKLLKIHGFSHNSDPKRSKKLKDEAFSLEKIEESLEKSLTFMLDSVKSNKSANKENMPNFMSMKKPPKVQSFLLKDKYSKMLMKKLKSEGFPIFPRGNLRKPKFPSNFLMNSHNFISNSSIDHPKKHSKDRQYYSESMNNRDFDFEIRDSPVFESINMENYRTPEKKPLDSLNVLSENVEFELEDTKIHDISKPLDSKVISTPHDNKEETPMKEKRIIGILMKKEYKNQENSNYHHANFCEANELKYVISAHWWKKWMDYVSFGDFSHENEKKEDSFETSPIKEERGVNRPGKIINRELIDEGLSDLKEAKCLILKENLLEHLDYEAVPRHIFILLRRWYGTDYEIMRSLKKEPTHKNQVFLELYPEKAKANKKYEFEALNKRKKKLSENNSPSQHTLDKNCLIF